MTYINDRIINLLLLSLAILLFHIKDINIFILLEILSTTISKRNILIRVVMPDRYTLTD